MESTRSTSKYWLYFFVSLIAMIAMIIFVPAYFWLLLPFVVTYFTMAMDLM
jgi:hypothetical protein